MLYGYHTHSFEKKQAICRAFMTKSGDIAALTDARGATIMKINLFEESGTSMKKRLAWLLSICMLFCMGGAALAAGEPVLSFSVQSRSMDIRESCSFSALLKTGKAVRWTSTDSSVAAVNAGGIVTGVQRGTAVIEAWDAAGNRAVCTAVVGYYEGVDLSYSNGTVNFEKLKQQGIDFAMIRSSYGWYDDKTQPIDFQFDAQFKRNVTEAKRVGMPFGLYHFSYAVTVQEARLEADYVLQALKWAGLQPSDLKLPIALDVEVNTTYYPNLDKLHAMGTAEANKVLLAFCNVLTKAGYRVALYTSKAHFTYCFDVKALEQAGVGLWMAWYTDQPTLTTPPSIDGVNPFMWQYADDGQASGVTGAVDKNVLYMSSGIQLHDWESFAFPVAPVGGAGDLNRDGYITAEDALMTLQAATEKIDLADDTSLADVDADGHITATDALLSLQYATRKITSFH